jgi:hypothetical protein
MIPGRRKKVGLCGIARKRRDVVKTVVDSRKEDRIIEIIGSVSLSRSGFDSVRGTAYICATILGARPDPDTCRCVPAVARCLSTGFFLHGTAHPVAVFVDGQGVRM